MKRTKQKIVSIIRNLIGRLFPRKFPKLYSTIDNPIEVPVQMFAYDLAIMNLIKPSDRVLDVGFGAGFGLMRMAKVTSYVHGIEIDQNALSFVKKQLDSLSISFIELRLFDGISIPYEDKSFDVVVCVDVVEHVEDYKQFINELLRVAKRCVLLSTPNRRPEYTGIDGKPLNYWHLREWSYEELKKILDDFPDVIIEWNLINGPFDGPLARSTDIQTDTLALCPVLFPKNSLS